MLVFSEAAQFFLTESNFLSLRASRKPAWFHSSPDRQPAARRNVQAR